MSIILPAYNAEDTIAEAVDSLRDQTFGDFEVLAVNDGSTDRTGEILDALAGRWERGRFEVIHQSNRGLAAARNVAVERSRGQWLALLDADDLWLPEKLDRCVDFLRGPPELSIVYTPMEPFDGRTGIRMEGHSKPCHAGRLAEKLFLSIFVHDPSAVFHRRVVETCGGFDESLPVCVGNEFWLRVSTAFEFGLIDEPLALRRWSTESLTKRSRTRGRVLKAEVLERFYYRQGGEQYVAKDKAMRRLAKVHYSAGRGLLAEKRYAEAREHFRKAVGYRPGLLRAYPYLLSAVVVGGVRG